MLPTGRGQASGRMIDDAGEKRFVGHDVVEPAQAALQLHQGFTMDVRFKDLSITLLKP